LETSLPPDLQRAHDALTALDAELIKALDAEPERRHPSVADFMRAVDAPLQTMAAGSMPPRGQVPPSREPHTPLAQSRPPPTAAAGVQRMTFRPVAPPSHGPNFRAGASGFDGVTALGVHPGGLARFDGKAWIATEHAETAHARGAIATASGDWIVFGEDLAFVYAKSGETRAMHMPLAGVVFHGARAAGDRVLLVGQRRGESATVGLVCEYAGIDVVSFAEVPKTERVNDAIFVGDGEWIVVGDDGTVARVRRGRVGETRSVCRGHLLAAARVSPDEIVVVGSGGHALSLSRALEARLEPVATTKDLRMVAVTHSGTAWAASREGRIVHRAGDQWKRVPFPVNEHPQLVAMCALGPSLRLLNADGAMYMGTEGT
jgi:hypothetical protein